VARIRRKRILIVDDEAMVRDVLSEVLADAGYQTVMAPSWDMGETGFAGIGYALVITDIFMPGRDGLEVIQDVRSKWPGVKILAISGGSAAASPEDAVASATRIGADSSLKKPFGPKELVAKVAEMIGEP